MRYDKISVGLNASRDGLSVSSLTYGTYDFLLGVNFENGSKV